MRKVTNIDNKEEKNQLTYKGTPFDDESKSKSEYTVEIGDIDTSEKILSGLGFIRKVSF